MNKFDFRIANCLDEQDFIRKYAITTDGKRYPIQKTEDGDQCFFIDNPYNDSIDGKDFYGRIYDAVRAVKEGYADILIGGDQLNVFTKGWFPAVMVDRKLGEEYRVKSIESFKNASFGYAIYAGNPNSLSGLMPVDAGGNIVFEDRMKVYSTDAEARKVANAFVKQACDLAEQAQSNYDLRPLIKDETPVFIRFMAIDLCKMKREEDVKHGIAAKNEFERDLDKTVMNFKYEIRQAMFFEDFGHVDYDEGKEYERC